MCHRSHTAASDVDYRDATTGDYSRNALISGTMTDESQLCFACHGGGAPGASSDIESAFSSESSHSLDTTTPFGPSPMRCSSCHDSHGMDKRADGSPYPALLRAWVDTSTAVFSGDAFCATCHSGTGTTTDEWDGEAIFRQTAHSRIATPTSGTDIVCSACHDPHGSDAAPMIARTVYPPASPTTMPVAANDRTQCYACHLAEDATYPGRAVYETSGHGSSATTVPATGDWADRLAARTSVETSRAIGECQVCHAPMGRADASGTLVPKLLQSRGRALCDSCHRAGSPTGAADLASLAYPSSEATAPELVASFEPASPTAYLGSLGVWSRDTTGSAPRSLVGPRQYPTAGRAGAVASGALRGDGKSRLVVAAPAQHALDVYSPSALSGIAKTTYALKNGAGDDVTPDLIAVGDFILDGTGRPEIAVVDRAASMLYAFRLVGDTMQPVGELAIGAGASSIAGGDVCGTDRPDIVVTSSTRDEFYIVTDVSGTLDLASTVHTRPGPTGASIGNAWGDTSANEIVVANSGVSTGTVSVYPGTGADAYASYDATGVEGARAVATLVGDVLPGSGGDEIAVALRSDSPTGTSALALLQRDGDGFGAYQSYITGPGRNTGSLALGDVDGDGADELVLGNAGAWVRTETGAEAPSVWVMHTTSDAQSLNVLATDRLYGGGVEQAGDAPGLVIADLGGVGESRHPIGAGPNSHVSTESVPVARHVECVDCHNVHESTATVAAAPAIEGAMKGASGVSMETTSGGMMLRAALPATKEYEVCLKCHSQWAVPGATSDIGSQIATTNASVHAVVEPSENASIAPETFTNAKYTQASVLYCTDCHGNANSSQPTGPHASPDAPILRKPYYGVLPSSTDSMLCYSCHKWQVYLTGSEDSAGIGSGFRDGDVKLHQKHVELFGYSCTACHASHGSVSDAHLLRPEVGYTKSGGSGSCRNACHTTGSPDAETQTYTP